MSPGSPVDLSLEQRISGGCTGGRIFRVDEFSFAVLVSLQSFSGPLGASGNQELCPRCASVLRNGTSSLPYTCRIAEMVDNHCRYNRWLIPRAERRDSILGRAMRQARRQASYESGLFRRRNHRTGVPGGKTRISRHGHAAECDEKRINAPKHNSCVSLPEHQRKASHQHFRDNPKLLSTITRYRISFFHPATRYRISRDRLDCLILAMIDGTFWYKAHRGSFRHCQVPDDDSEAVFPPPWSIYSSSSWLS